MRGDSRPLSKHSFSDPAQVHHLRPISACLARFSRIRPFQVNIHGGSVRSEPGDQLFGIERRLYFHVIVEVAVDVAFGTAWRRAGNPMRAFRLGSRVPGTNMLSPARQCLVRIAACIELLVAMQAKIEKIRGHILAIWPLSGSVRYDQCDVVLPQQLHEGFVDEAFVANLDGMAQGAGGVDRKSHAAGHVAIAMAGKPERLVGVAGQKPKEVPHLFGVVTEAGRELPQNGPEFFSQIENA